LAEIARTEGTVRVIVGLRVAFLSEGLISRAAIESQRLRIAQVRTNLLARLPPSSVRSLKTFEFIPFVALEVDLAGLDALRNGPEQASIQEDALLQASLAESVPLIGAPTAWASGYAGAGQTVAILDTGVDKSHPFLAGKVVSEACYSTNSGQTATVCPGGVTQSTAAGSGVNCGVGGCDHGTHVAGIAAGQGVSFSGVAKDASIIAIQVFSSVTGCASSNCITAFTSDILLGMQRVQALSGTFSIAAINLSLGGESFGSNCDASDPAFKSAVDSLRSIGIATVIASGNNSSNGGMNSPGCISSAISVGSTGDGSNGVTVDAVSSFSNSVSFLSLLAPGQVINSSIPGGGFANFSGTSMATPHVTGAWAVLKSKTPAASVSQILQALVNTGLPVTDPRNGVVKPRIRLDQAISALTGTACDYNIASSSQSFPVAGGSSPVNVTATAGCSWTAQSNVAWISIQSGSSGVGDGSVSFSVAANTSVERTGTLLIGGRIFVVTQPGIPLLKVDDGTFENAIGLSGGGTSYRVNRLTPSSYPATINSIAIYFGSDAGVRLGNALNVIAGANPSGSSTINNIQFQSVTATTVQILDQFNIYSIPALTINSGDFVVGVQMNHAAGVFPFVLDTNTPQNRSYRSTDGLTFTVISGATGGNYTFRAIQTAALTCPVIDGITPAIGPIGTGVSISGSGLTGTTSVKFANNVSASFTVNSDVSIGAAVPSGAVTGNITVGKTGCADIQAGTFTVVSCPTVSGINPATGPTGTGVVITGTNFTGVTGVKFSNNISASFTIDSAVQITATVPAGTVSGVITISRPGCTDIQTSSFTVVTCPTVGGINPTNGIVGSNVVITGANFTGVSAVKFSNNVSAAFTVDSATQITVTVPAGAITGVIALSRPGCGDVQTPSFTVTTPQYESDVAPRPGGNGSLLVSDWVQVGRFSVALDTPAVGSEFQRADCAPRATSGDGMITVADWVQAGRYSVSLDSPTIAGGPTAPTGFTESMAATTRRASQREPRSAVRARDSEFRRGEVGVVEVEMDGSGSENAIAFTISFDPSKASFVDAIAANGYSSAAVVVNGTHAGEGRVAIAIALPTGRTFAKGASSMIVLRFKPKGVAEGTRMQVNFDDSIVPCEAVSTKAARLSPPIFKAATIVFR
jgi:subtilisin